MERYKKGNDGNQISLLPMCLDDMLSDEAEVRSLEIIVDKMDIGSLGFTHCETKQTADMFKLYAYSYFNGIRSSRKIERECHRNIELMWLIGGLKPDFKTIADFRKDNKQPTKAAFQKFSIICCELGLIGKEIVAVDGSKFRASNSRLNYHNKKKIEEKIKHHAEKAEMYMALLDACDQGEDVQPTLTREEIIGKINKVNKRLAELSTLRQEATFEDAKKYLLEVIPSDATIGIGHSKTLQSIGITEAFQKRGNTVYDKELGATHEETRLLKRSSLLTDYYISGSNAVSIDGRIVNIDHSGNRVAALAYGPDKVFIVVGKNKITATRDEANKRAKNIASPQNAKTRMQYRIGNRRPTHKRANYPTNCQ